MDEAKMTHMNHVYLPKSLLASTRAKLEEWLSPVIDFQAGQFLLEGTGLHPGAVTGYFFVDPHNIALVKAAVGGSHTGFSFIYGTDVGDCEDMHVLAEAQGLLSSNQSPNAWCAVQAKSEGVPAVVGIRGIFSSPENPVALRQVSILTEQGEHVSVEISARTVRIEGENGAPIEITEGDILTLDGTTGQVFKGQLQIRIPNVREIYTLLITVIRTAIQEFGPAQGWSRYREATAYQRVKEKLVGLARSAEFGEFQRRLRAAREEAPLKVMATAHTVEGTLQARLLLADIDIDRYGDVIITPQNRATGLGLLRTERFFRDAVELDALRVLVLGPRFVAPEYYERAESLVITHESRWLHSLFRTISGCQTVVRTLCMPLNKLFPGNLDLERLKRKYGIDPGQSRYRIREALQESETFHGCRGARLHTLRHDLATIQIEAILRAASAILAEGGEVDLTILIAMVTFPEEITLYMALFDRVYEKMLAAHHRLPDVKLAIMVETSAAYHDIERFVELKGKHIQFTGALFGGNDFTAATLNMNRHDAVKTMIPSYLELGILRRDPFLTLHEDTVGKVICSGLWRMRKAAHGKSLCIGFGGEQAGDWESVAWLSRHAAPEGLNYVSTSPDRMPEALFAAAEAGSLAGRTKRYA